MALHTRAFSLCLLKLVRRRRIFRAAGLICGLLARYEPADASAVAPKHAMNAHEELSGFIASSFRSVWSLELLLLLKSERRRWTRDELISTLRASDLVVTQALDSLVAAGLATCDQGGAEYMPVSDDVAELVDGTEALYAVKPDAVRRMIVTSSSSGIAAFADAFRLR